MPQWPKTYLAELFFVCEMDSHAFLLLLFFFFLQRLLVREKKVQGSIPDSGTFAAFVFLFLPLPISCLIYWKERPEKTSNDIFSGPCRVPEIQELFLKKYSKGSWEHSFSIKKEDEECAVGFGWPIAVTLQTDSENI